MKVDLKKLYECVDRSLLRLILIEIGLSIHMVEWIVGFVTTIQYPVLVNTFPSNFFKALRGLRQGCSLLPLLFIMVMDGLIHKINDARSLGLFSGIKMGTHSYITQSFFMDDFLSHMMVSKTQWMSLDQIIQRFGVASSMMVNEEKSVIIYSYGAHEEINFIATFLHFRT